MRGHISRKPAVMGVAAGGAKPREEADERTIAQTLARETEFLASLLSSSVAAPPPVPVDSTGEFFVLTLAKIILLCCSERHVRQGQPKTRYFVNRFS